MLTALSILFILFFVLDRDVRLFLVLLLSIICINTLQYGDSNYYLRSIIYDSLIIYCSLFISNHRKFCVITLLCLISIISTGYELLSYYRTDLYPYRNIIQYTLLQCIIGVACWNCKWRVPWKTNLLN